MSPRPVTISQKELTGYGKAMSEAGVPLWSLVVEKPDGTKLTFTAGSTGTSGKNEIDRMLDESR